MMDSKRCPKCGVDNAAGALHCVQCGKGLKILLAHGELKGGLLEEGKNQVYKINYMPAEDIEDKHYDQKIEFVLLTPTKPREGEPDRMNYSSLRFTNPEQLRLVIVKMAKGYAYFKKEKGELNVQNVHSLPHQIMKEIEDEMLKILKGKI